MKFERKWNVKKKINLKKNKRKKNIWKQKIFRIQKLQNSIDVSVRQCQCHIMSGSSYIAESHNAKADNIRK